MDKKDYPKNWRNILWGEWRYSNDEAYNFHLFQLLTHESVMGCKTTFFICGLGVVYGIVLGFLIALIYTIRATGVNLDQGLSNLNVFLVCIISGGLIGSGFGLLARKNLSKYFFWSRLFFRLQASIAIGLIYWLVGGIGASVLMVIVMNVVLNLLSPLEHQTFTFFFIFFIMTAVLTGSLGIMMVLSVSVSLIFASLVAIASNEIRSINKLSRKLNDFFLEYEEEKGQLIQQLLQHKNHKLYFWWKRQPDLAEVEVALRQAIISLPPKDRNFWAKLLQRLGKFRTQLDQPNLLINNLQSDYFSNRFGATHALYKLGGSVVSPLHSLIKNSDTSTCELVTRILKTIAKETTERLAEQSPILVCPNCLIRCNAHKIELSWQPDLTYYGCRTCQQSREFLECPQGIVAVLDTGWIETYRHQNGLLQVNWSAQQQLFDFDRVEIIQATDEDVERFAMQVGNDTDPVRQPRYAHMPCLIAPDCRLSENSLRILQNFFGQVERQEIAHPLNAIAEDTELTHEENMANEESDTFLRGAS